MFSILRVILLEKVKMSEGGPAWIRELSQAAMICATALAMAGPAIAETMDFERLTDIASELAGKPYVGPPLLDLPPMEYDQFRSVLFWPERAIWKKENLPFQLQFFPVGWLHKKGVTVYEIADGEIRPMPIDTEMFSHARNKAGNLIELPNAISGFRLHGRLKPGGGMDEFLVFMGSSYFRALANGMGYGISARGLAVNTVHPDGEEFPDFTTFWIVRPAAGDTTATLYALLDGPSVTGAYRFTVATGEATTVEVKSVVFLRESVERLGIAPLTSMFWYGENSYPRPMDYRPEVHDSDGLLIAERSGEWIWRPLLLSPAIRHVTYQAHSPKGFGLLLRDRDFDNYQDLGAHNETRPSLWVEPLEDWGAGRVHLIELPTHNEYNDNVVAFWEPAKSADGGARFDQNYRLTWYSDDPKLSPLARVIATRRTSTCLIKETDTLTSCYDPHDVAALQEFVIDYSAIAGVPIDERFKPEIEFWNSPGAELVKSFVVANPEIGGWRAFLILRFPDPGRAVDLNLKLVKDEKVVSEKWTYLWQP